MGIRDIVDIVKLLAFFLPPSNHRYLVRFNPQSPVEILGIATFIPRKPFSDLWIPAEISHPDFNFSLFESPVFLKCPTGVVTLPVLLWLINGVPEILVAPGSRMNGLVQTHGGRRPSKREGGVRPAPGAGWLLEVSHFFFGRCIYFLDV